MYKFSAKSLSKLNNSKVQPKIKILMYETIKTTPIDFTIIETVRTIEQQKINVAKGVSKTMNSKHIPSKTKSGYCEAVDIVPYPIDWKNIKRFILLSQHVKDTARRLGIKIEYGGDWKTLKDYPHYQLVI